MPERVEFMSGNKNRGQRPCFNRSQGTLKVYKTTCEYCGLFLGIDEVKEHACQQKPIRTYLHPTAIECPACQRCMVTVTDDKVIECIAVGCELHHKKFQRPTIELIPWKG